MQKAKINDAYYNSQRRKRLLLAAQEFAEKVKGIPGVCEVVLCGSMVTEDPYPNDVDLAIVIESLENLPKIAKCARQISSTYHGWEVFVFKPDRSYVGRICHRRDCPTQTARCENADCGQTPFLGNMQGFRFDPKLFLAPPIRLLWMRGPESVLIQWKNMLGLTASLESAKLSPIRLRCSSCGNSFTFSVAERKIFAKRNLRPPRRCERCRTPV